MRKVSTFRETQSEDPVAWIDERQIGRKIGAGAGMRLHIDMLRPEELFCAVARQILDFVDDFTTAVVALAGQSFRVFVRQHRANRFEHRFADKVLGGDQLDAKALTLPFPLDDGGNSRVGCSQGRKSGNHVRTFRWNTWEEDHKRARLYHRDWAVRLSRTDEEVTNEDKSMRVLVTGGAGYAGRIAVELLMDDGHDVVVLDNFSKGHASSLGTDIQAFSVDLRDAAAVSKAIQDSRPEAIMHFGAVTVVPESMKMPGLYYDVNTGGTNHLLQAAVEFGVERFIFSSTAAVYGTPETALIAESSPTQPISPYGWSKLMAEQILQDFARAYGLRYAIFRYFNVAGATEANGENHTPETHLIPSAIFAAMGRRDPLTIFGRDYATPDGTAVRDYVHVADLARAHITALVTIEQSNEILNLGGGSGISVQEIVDAVERVSGKEVPVFDGPRREGDPPELVADINRAESLLGWTPRESAIDTIVASAWRWHERHPDGYR